MNVQEVFNNPLGFPVPEAEKDQIKICDQLFESVTEADIDNCLNYCLRMSEIVVFYVVCKLYRKYNVKVSSNKIWTEYFHKTYYHKVEENIFKRFEKMRAECNKIEPGIFK